MQLETLQKLKDLAGNSSPQKQSFPLLSLFLFKANDTLDLSQITIDDLKRAIDVPKELRSNQAAMIMYQMDEIRKLVSETSVLKIFDLLVNFMLCIREAKPFQVIIVINQQQSSRSYVLKNCQLSEKQGTKTIINSNEEKNRKIYSMSDSII